MKLDLTYVKLNIFKSSVINTNSNYALNRKKKTI